MIVVPIAEQIARLADSLYQSARVRFGEERAEILRPAIQQGAEYLAIVSSFPVDPEDELCLRMPLPQPDPDRTGPAPVETEPGTGR